MTAELAADDVAQARSVNFRDRALYRLLRSLLDDPFSATAVIILIILVIVAIAAPVLSPYDPTAPVFTAAPHATGLGGRRL